jgi:hypothetical protein
LGPMMVVGTMRDDMIRNPPANAKKEKRDRNRNRRIYSVNINHLQLLRRNGRPVYVSRRWQDLSSDA